MKFFISMKPFIRTIALCLALFAGMSTGLNAQKKDAKKQEKEFFESIDKEVERLTTLLDLEYWQVFYVDSILTHDFQAMQDEINELSSKKVNNTDMYYNVQYKWLDKIYYAYQKVFDEKQWAKYLKSGAERDKKAREKKQGKSK